jgi:hypothetical protein
LRTDEWYNFRSNLRGRVKILATLDETTYSGGAMGADHPIAWCQLYDGGRAWYTAGGHTKESYSEPLFRQHLLGSDLATSARAATTPLPTALANTSIRVRDSAGVERLAPLFFVSPTQINFLVPAGVANGASIFTVIRSMRDCRANWLGVEKWTWRW